MILVATNGASLKCLLTDGSASRLTQCCFLQFKLTNEVGNFCFFFFFFLFFLVLGWGHILINRIKKIIFL